jgi:hypothetical protein
VAAWNLGFVAAGRLIFANAHKDVDDAGMAWRSIGVVSSMLIASTTLILSALATRDRARIEQAVAASTPSRSQ